MTLTDVGLQKLKDNAILYGITPVLVDGEPKLLRGAPPGGVTVIAMADLVRMVEKKGMMVDPMTVQIVPGIAPVAEPDAEPEKTTAPEQEETPLEEMPVKELRAIADKYKIKAGLKKANLIDAIIKAQG